MTDVVPETSILSGIREKRRRLADQQTVDLEINGYDGELVIRYRLLDPLVEGKEIGDKVSGQFKGDDHVEERTYFALVDALIAGCVGIYARVNGALVGLAGEDASPPTYEDTDELAELLAFDRLETARQTVEAVFGGNRNAVLAHALALQRWMSDTSSTINTRTFG